MGNTVEPETKGDIILTPTELLKFWLENQDRKNKIEAYLNKNGGLKGEIAWIVGGGEEKLRYVFEEDP